VKKDLFKDIKKFIDKIPNNILYKISNNVLYLFIINYSDKNGKIYSKGIAKITYSPEKNRYNLYIVGKDYKQKICYLFPNKNNYNKCLLKFLYKLTEKLASKYYEFADFTEIFEEKQKEHNKDFDEKLFVKNIEKDLNIELIILFLRPKRLKEIDLSYIGNKKMSEVIKYIEEYIELLKNKKINLPNDIEIN